MDQTESAVTGLKDLSDVSRRVVVLSNRLPVTIKRGPQGLQSKRSVGGLVTALDPVLSRNGGLWIGWPGTKVKDGELLTEPNDPYEMRAVRLTDRQISRYYYGFSNQTLWPLCHGLPGHASFRRRDWEAYQSANQKFTQQAVRYASPDDIIWVHDYQLLVVPQYLREEASDNPLALFFHIPFPPFEVFRLLPWDRDILSGMLGADLIGFHVSGYVKGFLECVERRIKVPVDYDEGIVKYEGRRIKVGAYPLGVDFDDWQRLARESESDSNSSDQKVLLGVDRLDYTKGIPERIRAFELLLERHPEHREQVVLLQVAVPSRSEVPEYRVLKKQIDELVGRVNGRFATATWTPIQYLFRPLPRETLAALYRDADVAVVTPLRDGMNLVAKEYVACQVRDPGVLLLSRFTGAAETMREAVRVNPYDILGTADSLHQAIRMGKEERSSRMGRLRQRERENDVHNWGVRILADIMDTAQRRIAHA